jgi:hypothetical protein
MYIRSYSILPKEKAPAAVKHVFRMRGKLHEPSGTFSARAESSMNRLAHFPPLRKTSQAVRRVFRLRGNLLRPSGTFSARAESLPSRPACFPPLRIARQVNRPFFNPLNNYRYE